MEQAGDGVEAIERFRAARLRGQPFDAVIMDLTVPGGMGGREAVEQLRRIDPAVKAIVVSGYSDDPVMATFAEHGFAACIGKPFAPMELIRAVGDVPVPLDAGDFCLMDRKVVEVLRHLPERVRFVRGLRTFVGFRQVGVEYEREARAAGRPKYTFRKLAALAADGLVDFSSYPLRVVTYLGLAAVVLSSGSACMQSEKNRGSSGGRGRWIGPLS